MYSRTHSLLLPHKNEAELFEFYRANNDTKLPQLEQSLKNKKSEDSILISHDIKGSSANIGAEVVKEISEKMELHCRKGEYSEAAKYLPELKAELKELYILMDKRTEKKEEKILGDIGEK